MDPSKPRKKAQTKAEIIAEQVAEAVGAGKELHLESVDFSDANRPKTCLEVDFPILPVNEIAKIETASGAGRKPIYTMSKWWARRPSPVFRAMLLGAVTKAPKNPNDAGKLIWDSFYGNHQKNEDFRNLKVADIFMGGGTTLVEGARLGMQMVGNDLNPVAWLVVKSELADVNLDEVNKLFDHIEREVKPQIMPFYTCEGPNGEKGVWTHLPSGNAMGDDFDPLILKPEERKDYSYDGPEVIYTFWAKHGPCAAPGCGHRTPLMTSPVVAVKTLSVKAWMDIPCSHCHQSFDIESQEARMAPDVPLVVAETEKPYAIMDKRGFYTCPHCQHRHQDEIAAVKGESSRLLKKSRKNKKIDLTLLVNPDWLKGAPGHDENGPMGGTANSDMEASESWHIAREKTLKLFEIRGKVDGHVKLDGDTYIDPSKGTMPKKANFECQADTCGRLQPVLDSVASSGDTGAISPYALQCYSQRYSIGGSPYRGRFFKNPDTKDINVINAAFLEWNERSKGDLAPYWPKSEIPFGFMTSLNNGGLANHGFTHWYKMFNARQLLVHSLILKSIDQSDFSFSSKIAVLLAFQQYLRANCSFSFWNLKQDCLEPFLGSSNFHSKSNTVENTVFNKNIGRGSFRVYADRVVEGLMYAKNPWDLVHNTQLASLGIDERKLSGKSEKVYISDRINRGSVVYCESSTELSLESESIDLVVTDPPFGGLLHYSELSDFFYVWLRLILKKSCPQYFKNEFTPKTLEAVANRARNPDDSDKFYQRLLTSCWKEAHRILKPGGILAFTFHHSEDEPWVNVLESLFDAGFYLEVVYPIRSDETKGDGAKPGTFGSQTIEYDIIHVCRKRIDAPQKISWPRLRRQILADVRQLQGILEHHQNEGLPKADVQVIKRGKALEYFSRHYGQVYVEEGREFTVKEALVGINQLLDDQTESETGSTPVKCEPISRQFLRIFHQALEVPRDQMQKYLRGTGIGPSDFVSRGWTEEKRKIFHWVSPLTFAQERVAKFHTLHRDLDQAMVLVGACFADSGINVKKLLNGEFKPHPALGDLLNWWVANGGSSDMRNAAITARQLYNTWAANNQQIVQQQFALFDME